jgi:hypothetical protein
MEIGPEPPLKDLSTHPDLEFRAVKERLPCVAKGSGTCKSTATHTARNVSNLNIATIETMVEGTGTQPPNDLDFSTRKISRFVWRERHPTDIAVLRLRAPKYEKSANHVCPPTSTSSVRGEAQYEKLTRKLVADTPDVVAALDVDA